MGKPMRAAARARKSPGAWPRLASAHRPGGVTVPELVGALDQGTTSTRFIVFDLDGRIVSVAQEEHAQIFPRPGWVEHDPVEVAERMWSVIGGALGKAHVAGTDLAAVGITNQRETTVVWDRETGAPVHNAIVWQDTRTDALCRDLARGGGHRPVPGPDRPPARHLLLGPEGAVAARLEIRPPPPGRGGRARLRDDGLVGGVEPHRGAARHRRHQRLPHVAHEPGDPRLGRRPARADRGPPLDAPRIVPSAGRVGIGVGSLAGVPIAGILGDQQAALFGQTCFDPGEAKNTYGTGCFMLLNTGTRLVHSENGLLTTVGYQIEGRRRSTPSRGPSPSPGRSSSGCATTSASSRRRRRWRSSPPGSRTTATCTSFPPSPACSPPTGGRTPGG
jgi:glycerol kinase